MNRTLGCEGTDRRGVNRGKRGEREQDERVESGWENDQGFLRSGIQGETQNLRAKKILLVLEKQNLHPSGPEPLICPGGKRVDPGVLVLYTRKAEESVDIRVAMWPNHFLLSSLGTGNKF